MSDPESVDPSGVRERPYDDEGASRRKLWAFIGAVAAYLTIASVLLLVPSGPFFGHVLGVTAGSVAFADTLGLLRWCRKRYLRHPDLKPILWRIFVARLVISAGLLAVGYSDSAAKIVIVVSALGFCALLVSHVRTPKRIAKATARRGVPPAKHVARRIQRNDAGTEVTLTVPRNVAEVAGELLDAFGRWRRIPQLAPAVLVIAVILCSAAFAVGVFTGSWIGERQADTHEKTAVVEVGHPPATHVLPAPSPPVAPPITPPELREEWSGECHPVRQVSGATRKSVNAMDRLYDESNLSTLREGCYGQIIRHHYQTSSRHRETYFTTVGSNLLTGEDLSIAIDSERFGTVLFLWSAASLVQAIVAKVGPVGGVGHVPYYEAPSGGEYILIRCRVSRGVATIVLLRLSATEAWEELPPTPARAWLARMNAIHRWLWPSPPEKQPDGEIDYRLTTVEGQPRGTIHFRPSSGFAELDGEPYLENPAFELDLSELKVRAAQG